VVTATAFLPGPVTEISPAFTDSATTSRRSGSPATGVSGEDQTVTSAFSLQAPSALPAAARNNIGAMASDISREHISARTSHKLADDPRQRASFSTRTPRSSATTR
jgi:hypothetical protein